MQLHNSIEINLESDNDDNDRLQKEAEHQVLL